MKFLKYASIAVTLFLITVLTANLTMADPGCGYEGRNYEGLQDQRIETLLGEEGLIGEIHGSMGGAGVHVLTVREPENFFNYRFYSLVSDNEALLRVLDQTKRHDRVCVTGKILHNPSPQPHIFLSSIKVTEPWETEDQGKVDAVDLGQLADEDTITAKVHFASEDNKILVVEYDDRVLPIYVKDSSYAQDLYRGDIIQFHYQKQPFPQQPIHLQLLEPVEVVDSIVRNHEQNLEVEGYLVKFPRSPQIKFDVYALAVETLGIDRYFTLVNFEDPDTFIALRDRLSELWEEGSSTMEHDRNFDINRAIKLKVTGVGNMVDREQANPQILINSLDDIAKI